MMAKVTHYMTLIFDDIKAGDKATVTKICRECGGHTTFFLNPAAFEAWRGGALIQEVWPDVNKGDRETLISGIHSACWELLFGQGREL
jgi:hypothetical protein